MAYFFFLVLSAFTMSFLMWSLITGKTYDRLGMVTKLEDPAAYWLTCAILLVMSLVFIIFASMR